MKDYKLSEMHQLCKDNTRIDVFGNKCCSSDCPIGEGWCELICGFDNRPSEWDISQFNLLEPPIKTDNEWFILGVDLC